MCAARRFLTAFVLLWGLVQCVAAQGVYSVAGAWLDDQERAFSFDGLAGSYTVVTMAYGACRRVCSTSLRVVKGLHELARERRVPLNFVIVGLDPAEDKPADWARFRAEQKLMFGNIQFVTGSESATRQIAAQLGVHYWRYGEHVMHDFRIVLLSPRGKVLRAMEAFDDDPALLLP